MLRDTGRNADANVCKLAATHVHDLVAIAIGPRAKGERSRARRGVRAARLHAVQTGNRYRLTVTLTELAARQHVTPRYLQMLFEESGTTFTAYILERRLQNAQKLLSDPRHSSLTIALIAFRAGFGDLSHFNRSFKRRFGCSPSDIRAQTMRKE